MIVRLTIIMVLTMLVACDTSNKPSSNKGRLIMGKVHAEGELQLALSEENEVITNNPSEVLIKDSITATTIAESILFGVYGQENIKSQRPYETYLIKSYWVISGTLPKGYKGGTFLLILDSRNSKVIKITHSK